jgi:hypothetical protein
VIIMWEKNINEIKNWCNGRLRNNLVSLIGQESLEMVFEHGKGSVLIENNEKWDWGNVCK